jgi:uncharacterized protein with HEPN domain
MRPEKLYLLDIVEAAEAIGRFCEQVDEEQFLREELRQSAVLQKLIVIGEAVAHLPGYFQKRHREIVWEDIIGFRNIAVHEYFAVLWQIVWNTTVQDVPDLPKKIQTILADEYQGD